MPKNSPRTEGQEINLLLQDIIALLQKGDTHNTDKLLAKAYLLQPTNVEVLNLLGICSYQKKEFELALKLLNTANLLAPQSAQILGNIGLVNHALGKFSEALHFFDLSIAANDQIPETYNNRGNTLKGLSRLSEALKAYEMACYLRPNYAEALNNQGVIYLENSNLDKAISLFERAINANPQFSIAFNNLGNAYTRIENYEAAFQCYESAIRLNSLYVDAYLNYGNCLKKCKQFFGAIECYQRALNITANDSSISGLLGDAYYEIGEYDLAKTHYAQSLKLNQENTEIQLALAIAQIPKVYKGQDEVSKSREALEKQLNLLQEMNLLDRGLQVNEKQLYRHPFYLAYQNTNNEPILSRFGAISNQIAQKIQEQISVSQATVESKNKIRLGIVSNFFCDHPVWHAITKGWVEYLNRDNFEVYLFNTGGIEDQETNTAKSKNNYLKCSGTAFEIAQLIKDQRLDILLYPEIGMNNIIRALACLRLAPHQLLSWGHPETSGLPTIDYFLSAELFEPKASDNFYSEKLIKLPNLGTYVEIQTEPKLELNLASLRINPNLPILLCPGSPSKYAPQYDNVLVAIAKQLGRCQFIFFNFEDSLSSILKHRLNMAFQTAGLDISQFIYFIPFLKRGEFHALMKTAHVYLDTIGFSGFNTAMQALSCGLPVVSIEDTFMRGRLASGLLHRIGLSELICHSEGEYIDWVLKLAQNSDLRNHIRARIKNNYPIIFNDMEPIHSLERLLINLANSQEALTETEHQMR